VRGQTRASSQKKDKSSHERGKDKGWAARHEKAEKIRRREISRQSVEKTSKERKKKKRTVVGKTKIPGQKKRGR